MSFGSDPGRDDGSLPPVNKIIPDDARELDRDVIAYHRELRARRRRARVARVARPLRGHAALLPMIVACVAISMLAGTMFSLVTITPASAPTVPATPPASRTPAPASPAPRPGAANPVPSAGLTALPAGTFSVGGLPQPIPALKTAAVALIPADCGCDQALRGLARSAGTAKTDLYFVGVGQGMAQVSAVTRRDGGGLAASATDASGVFARAYRPSALTVLLIYSDRSTRVIRSVATASRIGPPALRALARPGR